MSLTFLRQCARRSGIARLRNSAPARRLGTPILLALGVALTANCGGHDRLTAPPIDVPAPSNNGPAPVGKKIYAVDLANRLLLFGSESPTVVSSIKKITGVPLLNRIVGIDYRKADGKLYGIGNDSRVYVINTETAKATAVSSVQFSPKISEYFDIHFGMGFKPGTDQIRLIAAESGGDWTISATTGKTVRSSKVRFKAGDKNAGKTPTVMGLAYTPPGVSFGLASIMGSNAARAMLSGTCTDLMYAIDAELAEYMGSCDDDGGDFSSLGPLPGIAAIAGCGEVKFDPQGGLWASIMHGAQAINDMGTVDPKTGWINWKGKVPDESPIQGFAFEPEGSVTGADLQYAAGDDETRRSTGPRGARVVNAKATAMAASLTTSAFSAAAPSRSSLGATVASRSGVLPCTQ